MLAAACPLLAAVLASTCVSSEAEACRSIRWLFTPYSCSAFAQSFWETTPLLVKRSAEPVWAPPDAARPQALLSTDGLREVLRRWHVRVQQDHGQVVFVRPDSFVHDEAILAVGERVTEHALEAALEAGDTVVLHNAELYWPPLTHLSLALGEYWQMYAQCNVYYSPPAVERAVSAHQDAQSVFIVQLEGRKRFSLHAPPERWMLKQQQRGKGRDRLQEEDLGEALLDAVLDPGDVLFIPRGVVHRTSTADSRVRSLHVTVGVETETDGLLWGSVLAAALNVTHGLEAARAVGSATLRVEPLRKALGRGLVRSGSHGAVHADGRLEIELRAALDAARDAGALTAVPDADEDRVLHALGGPLRERARFLDSKREQLLSFGRLRGETELAASQDWPTEARWAHEQVLALGRATPTAAAGSEVTASPSVDDWR